MTLDDERIERYSRQLILAEVGPRGQERLGRARVAVVGDDLAAGRVVAYLAAAGVGWIAADASLHAAADVAQPDLTLAVLAAARAGRLDALVVISATIADAAATLDAWATPGDAGESRMETAAVAARGATAGAPATFWIAGGRAGGSPPCPRCAEAALPPAAAVPRELTALRAALLGTVVATEVVKALLAIGVPLTGRGLDYDPVTATIASVEVARRPDCACRAAG